MLSSFKNKLGLWVAVISVNSSVTSFFQGEESVLLASIKSTLTVLSHDKSATSTNHAGLYNYILEVKTKFKSA